MFAPGATDFGVHNDFGVGEEDVKIKGSMFVFVTKINSFVMSF